MANLVTTRTITATLLNDREGVVRTIDSLADSASKLCNVARWTIDRIWNAPGEIPDESTLKSYLTTRRVRNDLNAQSSRAIVEELSGALQSWYEQDDPDANPPGYRKHGDTRPRSTVTFKEDGFKLDTDHQQVRPSKDIVEQCARRDVGTIAVGHPKHIRDDQNGGQHGNKRLHDRAFEAVIQHIEYKTAERRIEVERVDEAGLRTSKTCRKCGLTSGSNRVERGLYVCDECGLVADSDLDAAENMRATVTPNPERDRSNGCLAQPSVRLFDKSTGRVARRDQVVS